MLQSNNNQHAFENWFEQQPVEIQNQIKAQYIQGTEKWWFNQLKPEQQIFVCEKYLPERLPAPPASSLHQSNIHFFSREEVHTPTTEGTTHFKHTKSTASQIDDQALTC